MQSSQPNTAMKSSVFIDYEEYITVHCFAHEYRQRVQLDMKQFPTFLSLLQTLKLFYRIPKQIISSQKYGGWKFLPFLLSQ